MSTPTSLRPAVFFDRDGVLNVDRGYVYRWEDWEWIEGAPEAIRWLNHRGILVFVVTNQSGIARGYYTEKDFHELMAHVATDLSRCGAHIDEVRFCPHHPEASVAQYARECQCRKPKSGMIESLIAAWGVSRTSSVLIGDTERDIEAAEAAGVRAILYSSTPLLELVQQSVMK